MVHLVARITWWTLKSPPELSFPGQHCVCFDQKIYSLSQPAVPHRTSLPLSRRLCRRPIGVVSECTPLHRQKLPYGRVLSQPCRTIPGLRKSTRILQNHGHGKTVCFYMTILFTYRMTMRYASS